MRRTHRTAYELGMYAAVFDVQGNKVGLDGLVREEIVRGRHEWVEGLGCASDCACASCSQGLGALGVVAPDTTTEGELVSSGVSIATGALATAGVSAGALALGVSIGSAAGPIGTVVGAVAGYLTSKLFGHADYASIYSQVSNSIQLAQAYIQVAGKYPGRVYGWLEVQYIWSGLVHYGIFPQNYNGGGVLGKNPGLGVCTEAMISKNINACGTQSWINDVVVGTGTKAIQPQIERANKAGVYNPTQVWSSYVSPVWAGPVECSGCVDWFLPGNARSGYASLVQQLVIDTIDAIEFNSNDCLALYYGSIPSGWTCGCAKGCAGVVAAAPAAAPAPATAPKASASTAGTGATLHAAAPAATPALTAVAAGCSVNVVTNPSATIQAGSGQTLCDPSGNVWSFGTQQCNSTTCQGYAILINGQSAAGGFANTIAFIDGQIVAENEFGTGYWTGSGWGSLTSACVQAPVGWSQIGSDTSGNPVFESPSGVLYECSGTNMVMFSGNLDLTGGQVEPAQALQALIQGNMAAGQSLEAATQAALATVQETGTALTPEVTGAVADQVAQTYSAPATVATAPAATPATSSGTSLTTDALIGVGALALAGALWWAFAGGKHRRR
jgi:hypothetical protein